MSKRLLTVWFALMLLASSCAQQEKVARYTLKVQQEYPHDTLSYTQGLFFDSMASPICAKSILKTASLCAGPT